MVLGLYVCTFALGDEKDLRASDRGELPSCTGLSLSSQTLFSVVGRYKVETRRMRGRVTGSTKIDWLYTRFSYVANVIVLFAHGYWVKAAVLFRTILPCYAELTNLPNKLEQRFAAICRSPDSTFFSSGDKILHLMDTESGPYLRQTELFTTLKTSFTNRWRDLLERLQNKLSNIFLSMSRLYSGETVNHVCHVGSLCNTFAAEVKVYIQPTVPLWDFYWAQLASCRRVIRRLG